MRFRITLAILVSTLMVLVPQVAWAVRPANVTTGEMARLPAYCVDTELAHGPKGSPTMSPNAENWVAIMGNGFWTLHHYCFGLIRLSRLKLSSLSGSQREFAVNQIVSEYLFVIKNTPADFVLLPEVWTRVGEAYLLTENYQKAYDSYLRARRVKPDYWPAYTQWADVLMKHRQFRAARELIAEGLIHAPNSPELVAMYRELGCDASAVQPSESASSVSGPQRSSVTIAPGCPA